jgi:hypothetical protein
MLRIEPNVADMMTLRDKEKQTEGMYSKVRKSFLLSHQEYLLKRGALDWSSDDYWRFCHALIREMQRRGMQDQIKL